MTYAYEDEDEYYAVVEQAEDYCEERYGQDAILVERDMDYEYEVTFACGPSSDRPPSRPSKRLPRCGRRGPRRRVRT